MLIASDQWAPEPLHTRLQSQCTGSAPCTPQATASSVCVLRQVGGGTEPPKIDPALYDVITLLLLAAAGVGYCAMRAHRAHRARLADEHSQSHSMGVREREAARRALLLKRGPPGGGSGGSSSSMQQAEEGTGARGGRGAGAAASSAAAAPAQPSKAKLGRPTATPLCREIEIQVQRAPRPPIPPLLRPMTRPSAVGGGTIATAREARAGRAGTVSQMPSRDYLESSRL